MHRYRPLSYSLLFLCAALIHSAIRAHASYETPASLARPRALDPERAFRTHLGRNSEGFTTPSDPLVPPSGHSLALSDFDKRIDASFRVPAPLRNTVSLWLRIYTEFSTEQTVLFDKKHPEVIYEVLDFKAIKRSSRNPMAYELNREKKLKRVFADYRRAFANLAKKSKRRALSPDDLSLLPIERRIVASLTRSEHRHSFQEWNASFRAQTGQRDQVIQGLLAAETFFPKMEEIFEELSVPRELTRLPLVESSFNIRAHSKAGAQGVWQFMPLSGKEYLKIDPALGIDERLSPLKSTVAAARLLRRNLVIAGNWPLAITAYNHGYTGIKVLKPDERATALDGKIFELCSKKRRTLGYASSNYYAEFLALLHAEAYKDLFYGGTPLPVAPALTFHRMSISMSGRDYARRNGIPLSDFHLFNPDVKNLNAKLPVGFYVVSAGGDGELDDLISSIRARPFRSSRKMVRGRSRGAPHAGSMARSH